MFLRVPIAAMVLCIWPALHTAHAQRTWPVDSLMRSWPVQRLPTATRQSGQGVVRAVDGDRLYDKLKTDAGGFAVFADTLVQLYADLYGMPRRHEFEVLLGMALTHFPMIEEELRRNGLPDQLKYLPMALSAMNTQAVSPTGEAGLWMLPYPIAVRYGLEVNAHVDERHHEVKSTKAAARYLKDLHDRYHDWPLTVMAFACGPANVTRAWQRTNATDYRTLYPQFTDGHREVLPTLMAFMHLTLRSDELGITPSAVAPREPLDTVRAAESLRFAPLAQVLGMSIDHLRYINPVLCGDEVLAGGTLLLPRGQGARFAQLADSVARVQRTIPPVVAVHEAVVEVDRTITYKVRPGDNLGSIAQRHKVTVSQLKRWNGLRGDRINAGAKLTIHQRVKQPVKVPAEANPEVPEEIGPVNSTPARSDDPRHVSYTVQLGDSLYTIAARFPGISANDIMEANGITAHIEPGQEIKIPRP